MIAEMERENDYEMRGSFFGLGCISSFVLGIIFTVVYLFHSPNAHIHVPELGGVIGTWAVCLVCAVLFISIRVLGKRKEGCK